MKFSLTTLCISLGSLGKDLLNQPYIEEKIERLHYLDQHIITITINQYVTSKI
jgi:hypothetical protein